MNERQVKSTMASRAMPLALGIILGNLMLSSLSLFRDYSPLLVTAMTVHGAAAIMGAALGSIVRDPGILQSVISTLTVAFVLVWAGGLLTAFRVGSGHLVDFVLWSLFSQSAFVALIDGTLMLLAALAGAAWLPSPTE